MNPFSRRVARPGDRLDHALTVLNVVDGGNDTPVYSVWNHDAWSEMTCKVACSQDAAVREASLLESLAHPNIVQVLAVLRPGLVLMPCLEGSRLRGVLDASRGKRMRISDALRVAIQLGAALSHIHNRGWIHLDVKPDNVILTPGGRAILFGFDTARQRDETRPKEAIGTVPYISPEELRLEEVGPPADVFGLAVTLYELLTGYLPFPAAARGKVSLATATPRSARQLRSKVSARLENLLFACLENDPAFRPELSEILPTLNGMIKHGPRMWPEDFDPLRCSPQLAEFPIPVSDDLSWFASASSPRRLT